MNAGHDLGQSSNIWKTPLTTSRMQIEGKRHNWKKEEKEVSEEEERMTEY